MRRDQPDDALSAEARLFGIDPAALQEPVTDTEGVWPEYAPAMAAFLSVQTQMRFVTGGMGERRALGLDYTAVRAGFDMAGIKITPAVWNQVQLIELGARNALNGVAA